jgi:hypothetical protein
MTAPIFDQFPRLSGFKIVNPAKAVHTDAAARRFSAKFQALSGKKSLSHALWLALRYPSDRVEKKDDREGSHDAWR